MQLFFFCISGYKYDSLDRLNKAFYAKPKSTVTHTSAYDEYLSYDMNGNITQLSRFGEMDRDQALKIDELRYVYQIGDILSTTKKRNIRDL